VGVVVVRSGGLRCAGDAVPAHDVRLFEAWKFTDPDAAELRDDVLVVRSIQYMIGALAGLGLGLISLGVI
jgi:hypothetical protein